jgi:type IV pilus assembly protein PilA
MAVMRKFTMQKVQKGFTIVELLIVLGIIAVLAVVATPFARDIIISGKTEPTATDVSKLASAIRANFSGQGATPYTGVTTAVLANTGRGLVSAMTVTGAGATATLQHDIGATSSQVTAASGTITTAGDSFTVTFPTVNAAACPGLASQLSRVAEVITINATAVKAAGAVYNGATAQNACTAGDTNAFVFTFR